MMRKQIFDTMKNKKAVGILLAVFLIMSSTAMSVIAQSEVYLKGMDDGYNETKKLNPDINKSSIYIEGKKMAITPNILKITQAVTPDATRRTTSSAIENMENQTNPE